MRFWSVSEAGPRERCGRNVRMQEIGNINSGCEENATSRHETIRAQLTARGPATARFQQDTEQREEEKKKKIVKNTRGEFVLFCFSSSVMEIANGHRSKTLVFVPAHFFPPLSISKHTQDGTTERLSPRLTGSGARVQRVGTREPRNVILWGSGNLLHEGGSC